jgi:hypothetical protein
MIVAGMTFAVLLILLVVSRRGFKCLKDQELKVQRSNYYLDEGRVKT